MKEIFSALFIIIYLVAGTAGITFLFGWVTNRLDKSKNRAPLAKSRSPR